MKTLGRALREFLRDVWEALPDALPVAVVLGFAWLVIFCGLALTFA